MARSADGGLRGDHLGRGDRTPGRQAGRGGQPGRRDQRRRRAARSPISWPSGRRPWAGGWCATRASTTSRSAPRTARCSASTRCRRTISARPSTSSRSAPISWRPGARRSSTSAASPARTGSPTATSPSSSTRPPRRDLTGPQRRRVGPIKPGSEAALALAMANVLVAERGDDRVGLASALASHHPRAWRRRRRGSPPSRSSGWPASSRPRARAWPSRAGRLAARRRPPRCAPRSTCSTSSPATSARPSGSAPSCRPPTGTPSWRELSQAMEAGELAVVLVHDANPAYTLPKTSGFAARFAKVGFKVSTSLYLDETAALCDLLLPQHPRARAVGRCPAPGRGPWADAAGHGAGVQHPPRRRDPAPGEQEGRRLAGAVQRAVLGRAPEDPLARARRRAGRGRRRAGSGTRRCSGAGSTAIRRRRPPVSLALADGKLAYTRPTFEGDGQFVFLTYPHPMLHDGRGANKPWLMENADPVTKITWHSWVEVSPRRRPGARRARRRDRRADLALRQGGGPGLRLSRHPRRRRGDPARVRTHRLRQLRPGPRGQRARPPGRAAGRLRPLPLDPRLGSKDRPLPETRERRRRSPAARPRHRRGDAARGGEEGAHRSSRRIARRGTEARGQHRARARGDPRVVGGAASRHRARGLRQGASPVGHVDRSRQVHRLLGLRDRLLRGEQHPDGRGVRGPAGPGDDLDADRALLGGFA